MTEIPPFFSIAMVGFFAVLAVMGGRRLFRQWKYLKDNPDKKNDTWDPFG